MSYAKSATPSHILNDVENYVDDLIGAGVSSRDTLSERQNLVKILRGSGVAIPYEPSPFERARIDRLQAWHRLIHGEAASFEQLVEFENELVEKSSRDPLLIAKHTRQYAHHNDAGRSSLSVFDMRRLTSRLQKQLDERGLTLMSAIDGESFLVRDLSAMIAAEAIAQFFQGAAETGKGEFLGRLKAFEQLGITPLRGNDPGSTLSRDQLRRVQESYNRNYEVIRQAIYPEIEDLIASYRYPSALSTRKQTVAQSAFLTNPRALLAAAGFPQATVDQKVSSRSERDSVFEASGIALALRDVNRALETRVRVVSAWIEEDTHGRSKGPFTDLDIAKAEVAIEANARALEYVTVDIAKEIDALMSVSTTQEFSF